MARLPQGVRKRSNGTLEKRITIQGKRYSIYANSTKELSVKEEEFKKKLDSGIYTDNRNITLDKYFEEWLVGKRATTKSNSLRIYSCNYHKHISPELGKRKIQQIERREVMRLQSKLIDGLSATTVNSIMKTLKIILNDAVNDEIVVRHIK
ncbi:MAG: hypothetical protein E7309_16195 [Butyrivibrio sp.]|jgi:hypothetical protein|nr:hypothetical protein [Butyrivibrio sp.]